MSFIFNGNETSEQAKTRRSKAIMGALEMGALDQPKNVGEGIASVGNALAYRAMLNRQPQTVNPAAPVAPGADPWGGMRGNPQGLNLFGGLKGLFGFGAGK